MGLFQAIKNKLGIGGVKIAINAPKGYSKEEGQATGSFVLSSKSDQEIKSMEVKLIERYTTGRGDDKETKDLTMGAQKMEGANIKAGETLTYDFDFAFEMIKSNNDKLKEKGGAMGAIGSLGKFANNEKSSFFIEVNVDVKSAVLDPTEEVEVTIS